MRYRELGNVHPPCDIFRTPSDAAHPHSVWAGCQEDAQGECIGSVGREEEHAQRAFRCNGPENSPAGRAGPLGMHMQFCLSHACLPVPSSSLLLLLRHSCPELTRRNECLSCAATDLDARFTDYDFGSTPNSSTREPDLTYPGVRCAPNPLEQPEGMGRKSKVRLPRSRLRLYAFGSPRNSAAYATPVAAACCSLCTVVLH